MDSGPGDSIQRNRGQKMSDGDLLSLISMYMKASLGSQVAAGATISTTIYPSKDVLTTLEVDRYNALNAFFARPLGNEIENRAQVVLPIVRDTMSWIMPQLMRMFSAAKSVCKFDAENANDTEQAEVETMVVNHIFMQQNNGLLILHDFFWDALLLRNGYAEVYTKEEHFVREERYTGLQELELAPILEEKGGVKVDVLERDEHTQDMPMQMPDGSMGVTQVPVWDIKIRRTGTEENVCVEPLPPEEMRISPRARQGLEGVVFAAHECAEARSDLITAGYDKDIVLEAPAGRPNWLEIDALARMAVVDQLSIENPSDFSMQEIEKLKVIIKVDFDGDDIAELRRVIVLGNKIAENEVIEETPFVSSEAMRMPHRHTGISIYDLVMDLQIIETDLLRSGLDNLKISNNQRVAVDWRNCNFDDLLSSRPGGVVRGNGPPANWISAIVHPSNLTEQVLPALQYMESLRTQRTGIGKGTMGLDADELQNVTKGGQLAAMSAASLILDLIARLLAEGVKGIFLKIHSELMRREEGELEFEIAGKWMKVDPTQWRRRTKVTPNVGLGSGNQEQLRANIMQLGQAQATVGQLGLVGPKQAYETFKAMCEALGFPNPERYAMDPASAEYAQHMQQMQNQPHPPAPQVQAAQIRAKAQQSHEQSEDQRRTMELMGKILQQKTQIAADNRNQEQNITHEAFQQHKEREVNLDTNHLQILLKLIPAIASVLAAEKAQAQELGPDVTNAAGQIQ
jgi:hypothetical protein